MDADSRPTSENWLQNPSLESLSYVLRHSETWPEGFKWNYGDINNCAMGLAKKIWSDRKFIFETHDYDFVCIFGGKDYETEMSDVKPETVADKIDEYLAKLVEV